MKTEETSTPESVVVYPSIVLHLLSSASPPPLRSRHHAETLSDLTPPLHSWHRPTPKLCHPKLRPNPTRKPPSPPESSNQFVSSSPEVKQSTPFLQVLSHLLTTSNTFSNAETLSDQTPTSLHHFSTRGTDQRRNSARFDIDQPRLESSRKFHDIPSGQASLQQKLKQAATPLKKL